MTKSARLPESENTIATEQHLADSMGENLEIAPLPDLPLDFSAGLPANDQPFNRLANATWRILEEQRISALESAAEIDTEIKKLEARRDDALRAADMCLAGQKANARRS